MIGSGNNINSYSSHTHDHRVTECLHDSHQEVKKGGGGMGQINASVENPVKEEHKEENVLFGGLQGFLKKSKGFFIKLWYSDGEGKDVRENITAASQVREEGKLEKNPSISEDISAGILATSVVRSDGKAESIDEEESERKIDNIEGAVSGGLKKEESGIRKFLKQFGGAIAKRNPFTDRKPKEDKLLSENNSDLEIGDNSYLLDSYNKSGQYSTLVNDRREEGKFKARG